MSISNRIFKHLSFCNRCTTKIELYGHSHVGVKRTDLFPPCPDNCPICEEEMHRDCVVDVGHGIQKCKIQLDGTWYQSTFSAPRCFICKQSIRYSYWCDRLGRWFESTCVSNLHLQVIKSRVKYYCLINPHYSCRSFPKHACFS